MRGVVTVHHLDRIHPGRERAQVIGMRPRGPERTGGLGDAAGGVVALPCHGHARPGARVDGRPTASARPASARRTGARTARLASGLAHRVRALTGPAHRLQRRARARDQCHDPVGDIRVAARHHRPTIGVQIDQVPSGIRIEVVGQRGQSGPGVGTTATTVLIGLVESIQ